MIVVYSLVFVCLSVVYFCKPCVELCYFVIEAKQSRKRKGRDGNNTQDPEAGYNVKIAADGKRKTTYGYKMHATVGGFSFTISGYFDIIASFRILSVVAIPTLAFA
jgi:hypothetical protein